MPQSGSWATPVDAGEISVALQLGFLNGGNGCIFGERSFVTWTLVVFPDTSGGVPAVGGVGLIALVAILLSVGAFIITRRRQSALA
jgi:hypothetical protein